MEMVFKPLLIIVSIVALVILLSIVLKTGEPRCFTRLNGTGTDVLRDLRTCVSNCWSKHGFGEDIYNDDCYVIDIFVQDRKLGRAEIEAFLNGEIPVRAYFKEIAKGSKIKVKVRYNATSPEISLVMFT